MNTFESFNLSEQLMTAIDRLGFKEPTQIQRDTIPLIMKGKDIIGESATGSGKTLAFGTGIVEKCNPREGIQALVLVPTRELAEQVKDDIVKIAYKKPIKILAIYGGVSIGPQIDRLKKSEVVVATPGRLLDHLNRRTINTSKIKIFVLDEADRMVEMGFIDDVEQIIKACPNKRQTLIFSATMHKFAKQIAKKYMDDPVLVHAEKMVDPTKLKQSYYDVPSNLKKELLVHLLQKEHSDLVMVFCNTRKATEMLVTILKINGIKSAPIHGGLTQVKRLKTIDLFHKGKFQILICTDVAARGLHIEGVTHIYNYDIPRETGDYVHRIGRTARAGREGVVINILSNRDHDSFSRLLRDYKEFDIKKEERPYLKMDIRNKIETHSPRRSGDFRNKRPYQGRSDDRPRRSSSRSDDRPKRSFSRNDDRSKKPFSRNDDRPKRSFSRNDDKSKKPFSRNDDKPRRSSSRNDDRPKKPFSRNDDKPKRSFSRNDDRSKKPFSRNDDKPKRSFSRNEDRSKKPFSRNDDKPKRHKFQRN